MTWILTAVLALYVVLLGLFTALPARKHHWIMAIVRTVIVVIAAIASVPLAKYVASLVGDAVYGLITPALGADLQKFMGDVPLAEESLRLIVGLLLAPAIFLLLFVILRSLLSLIAWIVERFVPGLKKRSLHNTAIAMPIGAVNGILVALITLIPLCGYVSMASGAISAFGMLTEEAESIPEVVLAPVPDHIRVEPLSDANEGPVGGELDAVIDVADQVVADPFISLLNKVGKPFFQWMTSGKLADGTVDFVLMEELPHLTDSVRELIVALDGMKDENFTVDDKKALMDGMDHLLQSEWLTALFADAIEAASNTWLEGESFLGMAPPELGDLLQPSFDVALTVLSTESVETLRSDVNTVLDIVTELMLAGLVTEDPDYEALMVQLGENGMINGVMAKLADNPHMAPLASEIQTLAVRVVSSVLGDTLKHTDEYDPMIDQLAGELNNVVDMPKEEREAVIRDSVKTAFEEHGVSVPEDVALELSEKAIEELGEDGVIEGDELKDYFINHMGEAGDLAGDIFDENGDLIPDELPEGIGA